MDQRNPAPPWMVAQQNNGMFTIYQLVQDFATIHSMLIQRRVLSGKNNMIKKRRTMGITPVEIRGFGCVCHNKDGNSTECSKQTLASNKHLVAISELSSTNAVRMTGNAKMP